VSIFITLGGPQGHLNSYQANDFTDDFTRVTTSGPLQPDHFSTLQHKPGDIVTLYATGLGATNPAFASGQLADQAASVSAVSQVTIGSLTVSAADVLYAEVTPGFAGLYQFNIRIPNGVTDGDQSVVLSVNGVGSPSGAYLTTKQ